MISETNSISKYPWLFDTRIQKIILVFFAFILYANTLGHEFVLDDGVVITENKFVKKGFAGIPDLLTKDSFYGFFKKQGKDKLVSGGRYRPMSMLLFAILYQLFGADTLIFHLFSICMFALLGLMLYLVLKSLFKPLLNELAIPFAWIGSLLFIAHPIHTECVANVKGLDEICALLFSLTAFYMILRFYETGNKILPALAGLAFFCGLLSKENAIAFLGIIPLGLILLYSRNIKQTLSIGALLFIPALIFIFMRSGILGFNPFTGVSNELMNNPFLVIENGMYHKMSFSDKAGIICYTLYEYLRLLIFPHPLTHDYYPKQIPVLGLFSIKSILAIIIYLFMIGFIILRNKKSPIITFSFICYLFPLFIVSNILFPIGTNMGERFLFMPSFGYCILITYLLFIVLKFSINIRIAIFSVLLLLLSIKTISRNPVWHDNLKLFTTDSKISKNSAKIHNAIAGVMMEKIPALKDSAKIHEITSKARIELEKAINIHPMYMEAQLQLGNVNYFEKNYEEAIKRYNVVLQNLPEDEDAFKNLQMALRERGWQIGMQTGNSDLAKDYLRQALGMNPNDPQSIMLMGIAEGTSKNYQEAANYFYKVLKIDPKNAQAWFNLGITFKNTGEIMRSDSMFKQATQIDPEIYNKNGMDTK
jgi:Tfp pilus assembly protein PilF